MDNMMLDAMREDAMRQQLHNEKTLKVIIRLLVGDTTSILGVSKAKALQHTNTHP